MSRQLGEAPWRRPGGFCRAGAHDNNPLAPVGQWAPARRAEQHRCCSRELKRQSVLDGLAAAASSRDPAAGLTGGAGRRQASRLASAESSCPSAGVRQLPAARAGSRRSPRGMPSHLLLCHGIGRPSCSAILAHPQSRRQAPRHRPMPRHSGASSNAGWLPVTGQAPSAWGPHSRAFSGRPPRRPRSSRAYSWTSAVVLAQAATHEKVLA